MSRASSAKGSASKRQQFRFEAAVQNIFEGLCMFDAERKLVICNERYASIYKLPPHLTRPGALHADIIKYRIEHGVQPVGTEQFLDHHEELLREGKAAIVLVTLGDGRVISVRHQPMIDGGWVSTHEDVTEELARAKALETQNLRFESALENMTQGLCMFDCERRLVVWNRVYAEMYKIPPAALKIGMTIEDVLRQRLEAGNVPVEGGRVFLDKRRQIAGENTACVFDVEMIDGRVISIRHQPMADGGWVATHEDITEQRRNLNRIQHMAGHDALTGLANRILFREHLDEVQIRTRNGETLAVLCVDLDHFKSVNDTFGHAAGDMVLKTASQRLLACVRDGDFTARLGGDEFTVLVGGLDRPEDATLLAERIVKAIDEPIEVDGHRIVVGASVGIAVAPIDGDDGDSLMKNADLALYRAKSEGRGTYHFYERSLDAAFQERRAMEIALRAALRQDEFRLVFQPLVNLTNGRVCAFEALLRWQHPSLGLVAPANFIPVAEETRLIVPIGEWVLHEACAHAAQWPEPVSVAVNLSPVQFAKPYAIVEHVKSALRASGLRPGRLEVEITESVLMAGDVVPLAALRELKAIGVRVALDDFGTGYSSLSYLRRFSFDKIKIDRSFVQESAENPGSFAIVKAVIGLGHSLGVATTAEGVETEAQLDIVREQGCTEVQGFLFSPPLPAGAVKEFAARLCTSKSETPELATA